MAFRNQESGLLLTLGSHNLASLVPRFALGIFFCVLTFAAPAQTHDLYGLWVKRAAFGSGGSASISHSVVDEVGNVYVAGQFSGTLNFSDDLCNPVMRTASTNGGATFLVKFNAEGKYQWDVTAADVSSNTNKSRARINALDYANGKILFGNRMHVPTAGNSLPLTTKYTNSSSQIKNISGITSQDGAPSNGWNMHSFQIIDALTGALETSIGAPSDGFITGTSDIAARLEGDNIFVVHFGWGSIYPPTGHGVATYSVASSFKVSDGSINFANTLYPNQPLSPNPANCDGSRIRKHISLPSSGSHIMIHYAHDYTDQAGGAGVPSYYIDKYSALFNTHLARKLISAREIDASYPPAASCDASDNVYLATNFGRSQYWNTHADISNSNILTNFLGSSMTFTTAPQKNKVVLSKLDPTSLNIIWAKQIGSAGTGGADEVYFYDIKTKGDFTYLTGHFNGTNVPFGNGNNLTSTSGSSDGFYAVYNNLTGDCVYAVKMGGANFDNNVTLFLSDNGDVLIGGTYESPSLQVDPAGRLYPITSDGTNSQGFVALYSQDADSEPVLPGSSFGDAPESYGLAVHYTCNCLKIGALDPAKLQESPAYSTEADSDENDDGFAQNLLNGFTNLTHANHSLDASGNLSIKIRATNASSEAAKMKAWIDFNQNGLFDTDEASAIATVSIGTNNSDITLTWTNAAGKMRNGKTFLRIRLTTDDIADGQSNGLFFNGEVEDYQLNFNVMEVSKTVSPTAARMGDTLTYTINITNKLPTVTSLTPTAIIDPFPLYTTYAAASADPTTGVSTQTIIVGGQSVLAIRWDGSAINSGASKTYKFKVTISDTPQLHNPLDSIIPNIAYVVLNGDSIPSTGANCDRAEVEVIVLEARNDTVSAGACLDQSITIDVLDKDLFICNRADLIMNVVTPPALGTGAAFDGSNNLVYTLSPGFVGRDSLEYSINCNGRISTAWVFIDLLDDSDTFTDDLWYFGNSPLNSPGIIFKKNSFGEFEPHDASGVSKVNTLEQCLVVSSPYCDGQAIFYTQHDQLYTNQHTNMLNGSIQGHSGCADGLAACYMGNNKYLLFAVTNDQHTTPRGMKAYIVDMNGDNGLGARTADVFTVVPDGATLSEGVELVSRAGTSTQYWLIYQNNNQLISRLVDVSNPTNPITSTINTIAAANLNTAITSSLNGDQLAITYHTSHLFRVVDFDNQTGTFSNIRNVSWTSAYGVAFSPNGKYLYVAGWTGSTNIYQYDVSGTTPIQVGSPVQYWEQTSYTDKGGGMKLGPDGKIYVSQSRSQYVGVISDPDFDSGTPLSVRYNIHGFQLSLTAEYYLRFSTGLTKPAVLMCNTNQAPVTAPDVAVVCQGVGVNVLRNDSDPDGHNIYLTEARFVNPSDYAIADLTVNSADSTIAVTLKSGVILSPTYQFEIEYGIKDNGIPASACATGSLKISFMQAMIYPDVRLQLCSGLTGQIHLSAYLDTVNFASVAWSKVSTGSPDFVGSTASSTGSLNIANFSLGTHIYKYSITDICGNVSDARVYIKYTSMPVVPSLIDTIVICQSTPSAAHLQLNQMLGLEAGGTWGYDFPLNPYVTAKTPPSKFAGAYIFDAATAWAATSSSLSAYKITYNGDTNAAAFTFNYTTGPQTCFGNRQRKLVLVITSKVLPLH
jgi:uncharacterized repeat protein (TIGR01451 family)